MLSENSSMTTVTANICGLGEAAAALIAQAVLTNPACLTVLSLAGNSLGLKGCVMLIEALHSTSTQISSLDIASNHISFVHQHKLELILDPSDVHTCDCCSLAGTQSVWRCELCNFDICPSCCFFGDLPVSNGCEGNIPSDTCHIECRWKRICIQCLA